MNFLSTVLFLIFQTASPNNANTVAPVESYDTFGVHWAWFVIAAVLVLGAFYLAYRKGMLSWLPGFKTSTKHVQTRQPPPTNEPPTGPRSV